MADTEKDLREQEAAEAQAEAADTAEAIEETEKTEETEETADTADTVSEETKERRFFKKKDKKEKKDERDEKIAELTDRYTRLMAEFDNYRKRTEKEKAQMYDMGVSGTVEKLLPIADNFERGLASIPEEDRESPVATGMDQIYKQLMKMLGDLGVEAINAEGKEFDPNLHNAVMQVEDDELQENTVKNELLKGYTYRGSVVRHSMVSVVK